MNSLVTGHTRQGVTRHGVAHQRCPHRPRAFAALGALAACLIGASGAALAGTAPDVAPAVTVSYGDLNLATDHGNSALYTRIRAAARQVCFADRVDIRDLGRLAEVRSCESQAIARAVRDVHSPQLAAIHQAHQPHG